MIFKKKENSELFIAQKMEAGCRKVAGLEMVVHDPTAPALKW